MGRLKIRETTHMNPKYRSRKHLLRAALIIGGVLVVLAALLAAGIYFEIISL